MKKTTRFLIGGWFVIFLIGFFAGREQMKYQIQSVIVDWFSQAFGGVNNDQKEEKKKEVTMVKPGEFYTFGEGEKTIKVKVRSINNYKTENGKKMIVIAMESENNGKKINFKSFSQFSVLLEAKDGTQYRASDTEQTPPEFLPEWFWGCIACENNPGDKDIEMISFDLPESLDLNGSKLRLNEDDDAAFLLSSERPLETNDKGYPIL